MHLFATFFLALSLLILPGFIYVLFYFILFVPVGKEVGWGEGGDLGWAGPGWVGG